MQSRAAERGSVLRGGDATIAVNPGASRVTRALVARTRNAAIAAGYRPDVVLVRNPGELERLGHEAAARGDGVFVVVGGDGSVARAAAALAGSEVPLLIAPAGTGNLLAAALGQSGRSAEPARLLRHGRCRTIDLGVAERAGVSRVFTVAAGAGFDAAVMAATPQHRKRRLGPGAYVLTAARLLASVRNARFRLTIDGRSIETDAAVVLAANCLDRALGLLRPRISIDPTDGRLDVFVVDARDGLRGLASTARLFRAGPTDPFEGPVRRFRAHELTIEAAPAQPVELDGDTLAGVTPVTFRALPSALRVVVAE